MKLRITAKGIISVDNCVLLVRKPHGAWDLPGGRLNRGETPKVALEQQVAAGRADSQKQHLGWLCQTNAS